MQRTSQVQHRNTSRLRNARQDHRFEEEATSILRVHAQRLDVHRRSVILFYLTFGLIAGFIIGMVGAKGAFASPVVGESEFARTIASSTGLENFLSRNLIDHDIAFDDIMTDGASITASSDSGLQKEPERYAALLLSEQPIGATLSDASSQPGVPAETPTIQRKASLMGLLLLIFGITATLSVSFLRHLNAAYAPRRRVYIRWASR